jgi:DNA repair protein RadA/Sms
MARSRSQFRCSSCQAVAPKWLGRCAGCGAWNSLVEEVTGDDSLGPGAAAAPAVPAVPIGEVPLEGCDPVPTGVSELDRVLGGGLVPGSVTLLGGEPGIGKSTLVLQAASGLATASRSVLVVSAEESTHQVRRRAERLGTLRPRLLLATETGLPEVLGHLDATRAGVLVLDSIQTVAAPDLPGAPGSVSQVAGCAARLAAEAKARDVACVLVGHVTKDGALAGPRVLEHLVDTVLTFEGDRHHALRLLRATKHRFGSTDELGIFRMSADGLATVDDASHLFLADRRPGVAGSAVVAALDGRRPMLVEVQALVAPRGSGRRSVHGLVPARVALLAAVIEQFAGVPLFERDVYATVVGGARVLEPAADVGVALAVLSAVAGRPLPADLVAIGEVGLGGELRQVPHLERRLAEAARLGFRQAVVPELAPEVEGLQLRRVPSLAEAASQFQLSGGPPRPGSLQAR